MRTRKFRAWHESDGANGTMVYQYGTSVPDIKRFWNSVYYDAVFMQYTGMKDKNDKEIYEGDLLKLGEEAINEDYGYHKENPIQEMIFQGGSFSAEHEYFGWEGEGVVNIRECEVIGNKYENSVLLTQ